MAHYYQCWNASLTASVHSHPLCGLRKHSASSNECQWVPLFQHWGIQWHTFASWVLLVSDTILPDCPSAAICHLAKKCNRVLVGRFNLCHTTSICLWCHGIHRKIEDVTFRAALVPLLKLHSSKKLNWVIWAQRISFSNNCWQGSSFHFVAGPPT